MAATTTFICPECNAQLNGPANLKGKKVRCKKCGKTIVLGAAASASTKPPPQAKGKTAPRRRPPATVTTTKDR